MTLTRNVLYTSGQLDYPRDDDDEEGQQLGVGEDILYCRGPLHLQNIFNVRNIFMIRNFSLSKIFSGSEIFLLSKIFAGSEIFSVPEIVSTDLVTVDEGEDTDTDCCQQSE